MQHHFKGKDFLKLADFTPEEVGYLVDTAIDLKRRQAMGELYQPLAGKTFDFLDEHESGFKLTAGVNIPF